MITGSDKMVSPALPSRFRHSEIVHAVVEHGTASVFLIDVETKECKYVSPAVSRLLGWRSESLRGRNLSELMHPEEVRAVLARAARCGTGAGPKATPTRMLHLDGTWVPVQATASPLLVVSGRTSTVFTVAATPEWSNSRSGVSGVHSRLRGMLEAGHAHGHSIRRDGNPNVAVQTLVAALELRDDNTGHHARRVTELALGLARLVDPQLACDPDVRCGFLLHDIGKIGIPDSILLNPGRLHDRDVRILQMHTTLGENLISTIPFGSRAARDIVACHHERWDGRGYPWGLAGEEIPLAARIFAVADAFDAITSARPYRPARSMSEAIDEIQACAGTQFDPAIVRAFVPFARSLDRPDHCIHLLRD